eukprot:gene11882-8475_t
MAAALNGGAVSALVIFFIVCGSISVMGLVVLTCWYQRQDEKVYVDDLVQRGDAVDVERGGATTATGAGPGDGAAAVATRRGSEGRGSAVLQSVEELLFHRELVDEQKLSDWRQQLQLEAAGATVHKGSRPPSAAQRALDATLPPLHHHPMPALAPDELRLQHELHRHPHRFQPADDATASRVDVDRQPAPASSTTTTTPSRQPSPRHVASPHSHVPHGRHPQPSTATATAAEALWHSSHGTAAADKAKPPPSHQRRHSLDSAALLLRTTPLAAIATSPSPSASLGPTAAAPTTAAATAAAVAATMDPLLLEYRDQLRHDQQQKRLEALRHDPALVAYQRLATATATAAPPPTSTAVDAAEQRRRRAQRRRSF